MTDEIDFETDFLVRMESDEDSSGAGSKVVIIDDDTSYLNAVASFAYTISRFTSQDRSGISIDIDGNLLPLQVNCINDKVSNFLGNLIRDIGELKSFRNKTSGTISNEPSPYLYNCVSDNHMTMGEGTDILLDYSAENGKKVVTFHYSDRFSPRTIDSFVETFTLVLKGMKSVMFLSEIELVSSEGIAVLESYHGKEIPLSAPSVVDVFRRTSVEYSDSVCVSCGTTISYTYREVAEISDGIAAELQSRGAKKGDVVCFLISRSADYLNCTLGILKTGAAYVGLDDEYPDYRIIECINDSGAKYILVDKCTHERVNNLGTFCSIIDIASCTGGNYNPVRLEPGDLFAIIYTSGSTGKPKGARITHRSAMNHIDTVIDMTSISRNDIFGYFPSIGFVAHVLGIHHALVVGACVDVIPANVRRDIESLDEYVACRGITSMFVTPRLFNLLANTNTSLRMLMVSGEDTSGLSDSMLFEPVIMYGMTETMCVTHIRCSDKKYKKSVGSVVRNTKAYILDKENRRAPMGAIGMLGFAGFQTLESYVGNPNPSTLIHNEFADDPDYERIFKTGDMGRFLPDGTIGFYGRRDRQVKIRGNRVELSEIESAIMSIPGVSQCVALAIDFGRSMELCAYVVCSNGITDGDIKDIVATKRPSYMIPAFIVRLTGLPMTFNGKIDVSKLPMPDADSLKTEFVAPRNRDEEEVCSAFSAILGVDTVGINDDFMRLGGDSLKAMALQRMLHGSVGVAEIIAKRTPRDIAASLSKKTYACLYEIKNGCPLNVPQMNVFLDIQVDGGRMRSYEIPFSMEFENVADSEVVERALKKIIDAQPALRGRISLKDGLPWMFFDSQPSVVEGDVPGDIDMEHPASFAYTNRSLKCRFLHTVFDGYSVMALKKDFEAALAGSAIENDEGVLYSSTFYGSVAGTDRYAEAQLFYELLFADGDPDHGLICDVPIENSKGSVTIGVPNLESKLSKFIRETGFSKGIIFTSAFAYTLSRFNGRSDAVFCIVENGRFIPETYDSIGMFVRTLPVRIDCSNTTVSEFIRKSSDVINGTIHNGFVPMTELNKKYGVTSSIIMQYAAGVDVVASLEIEDEDVSDISAMVIENDKGTILQLKHSNRFTDSFLKSIGDAFVMILEGLLTCSDLSKINIASAEDIAVQDRINETEHPLRYNDIIQAFNDKVSQQPDHVFVTYLDRKYTYSEADRITDSIAFALAKKGIHKSDNVAILVPRSEWHLLAAIAVLKTGATYVPIDGSYPDERISFMLSDSSSKCIIVSEGTIDRAQDISNITCIDVNHILNHEFEVKDVPDAAVIIYTSGTTGVPKGTKVPNKGIINMAEYYKDFTSMSENDTYGLFASIGFDAPLIAFYASIVSGASIDIVPDDVRLDMASLRDHFSEYGVTHTLITTQLGRLFTSLGDFGTLKVLYVGGEKLGPFTAPNGLRVIDAYGPTEASVFIGCIDINEKSSSDSIGRPNHNTKVYILDKEGRRIPNGAVGELFITGEQVALGYLNNAGLTGSVFVDNNFATDEERKNGYSVMYSTGDYFRYLPDGTLGVIGRRDGQVKIRGNRVELTEVEAVIRTMDGVKDVTVQAITNDADGKELCAYVVPGDAVKELTAESVQSFVSERKPAYMVPSYVMFIDKIPSNVNGKVDRRALPRPDTSSSQKEYVAPRNPVEEAICKAMAETLGLERIGIDHDFITLGGDSLKAIGVQNICKVSTTADILRYRSPRMICEHIAAVDYRTDLYTLETGCPLSESQLNVYLDIIANDKKGTYVIPFEYPLPKKCSRKNAVATIQKTVTAHIILRSRIEERDGEPWIVCCDAPDAGTDICVSDVGIEVSCIDVHRCLSMFSVTGNRIVGLISHIAFDGFSASILTKTFDRLFSGEDVKADFGFLTLSSFDSTIKRSERYSSSKEYFDRMFCDADTDSGLIDDIDGKMGSCTSTLTVLFEDVERFVRSRKMSIGAFFVSAFAYTLSRFTGRSDAVFTIAENGRDLPGLGDSVGMFVRTIPIRMDCSDRTVSKFLSDSADVVYGAISSAIYPFRLVHNAHGIKSDIIFQYMAGIGETTSSDGTTFMDAKSDDVISIEAAINDLSFAVKEIGGKIAISITHSSRYSNATAERLASAYDMIVTGLLSKSALSDIRFTSASDIAILDGINETEHPLRFNDIIQTFKEKVAEQPEHTIVTYLDRSYTYEEADRITDNMAYALSEKGVRRGDNVAILVPRSEWYLLATLAVLKTGAAYVPIDDSYPDERIEFMISDSSVDTIITSRSIRHLNETILKESCIFVEDMMGYRKKFRNVHNNFGDTFAILYTSGTTGMPKGTIVSHMNVVSHLSTFVRKYEMSKTAVYSSYFSFGFDASITGLLAPVICGATVDIVPNEIRYDMRKLIEHQIITGSIMGELPTSVCRLYLETAETTPLRLMITGGEAIGEVKVPDGLDLQDTYGPTELFDYITSIGVRRKTDPSSIGTLCDNNKAYILDGERRRVPYGAVGELYVSGLQVTGGYLNREKETSEAFFVNPFVSHDIAKKGYDKMYRTGDFARYLPDGTIGFLGRRDGQVKIRGNRVELTEVEAIIRQMPRIKDVTVKAIINNTGSKELCAYIVSERNDCQIFDNEIRDFVRGHKPPYMVPTFVIHVDRISLNVNGKVDSRSLPLPTFEDRAQGIEPSTDIEAKLCELFSSLLNVRKVYANDDFFDLGGTSLLASKLLMGCMTLGYDVEYRDIFSNHTPITLASVILAKKCDNGSVRERSYIDESCISHNVISELDGIVSTIPRSVVLTGASGFLGIHILKKLLEAGVSKVICVTRSSGSVQPELRIRAIFNYYFGGKVPDELLSRISVVSGDLTDPRLRDHLAGMEFDIIINSAAVVKHFSADDSIEHVNVDGVKNLIAIAMERKCKLIQISTDDVSGYSVNGSVGDNTVLKENVLDIGQVIDNQYIHSKFMAERHIIDSIPNGLEAKILRVGNLMGRRVDSEFQINFATNSFIGIIRAIVAIGCFPVSHMDEWMEMSPIDSVAEATILLLGTQDKYNIFHVNNCNKIRMAEILDALSDNGFEVKMVSDDVFEKAFMDMVSDQSLNNVLMPMVAYRSSGKVERVKVPVDCSFTVEALRRLGFSWPEITSDYIHEFIRLLKAQRFFDVGRS